MDLLVEIHVFLFVGVSDTVLEHIPLHLIEDRRAKVLELGRQLQAEEDVVRVKRGLNVAGGVDVAMGLKRRPNLPGDVLADWLVGAVLGRRISLANA